MFTDNIMFLYHALKKMQMWSFPAFYNVCYLIALFAQAIMGFF